MKKVYALIIIFIAFSFVACCGFDCMTPTQKAFYLQQAREINGF